MSTEALSARDLTRRLIDRATAPDDAPDRAVLAAQAACEHASYKLSRTLGAIGFHALLTRALAQAQTPHSILTEIRIQQSSPVIGGVEEMIERSAAAVEAGADMIFLPYLRRRDVQRVQRECTAPMLQLGSSRIDPAESGAKVIIYPAHALFAAYRATRETVRRLRNGQVDDFDQSLVADVNRVIGSPDATSVAEEYGVVSGT